MTILAGYFALGLVVAGCGGGGDSSTDATEQPTADTTTLALVDDSEPTVSPDGRLTILNPPADVEITITDSEAAVDLPGLASEAAYEFGPDGATFDPPLQVEFTVPADIGLVTVFHESGDTSESLEVVAEEGLIRFELASFSRAEILRLRDDVELVLSAPPQVVEGEIVPVAWKILERNEDRTFADSVWDAAQLNATGDFSGGGVVAFADDVFRCAGVGLGAVGYDGRVSGYFTSVLERGDRFSAFGVDLRTDVECVPKPVLVPPTDTNCWDRNTGEPREDCTSVADLDAAFSNGPDGLSVRVTKPEGSEAVLSIGGSGEGDFRMIEMSDDGTTNGFFGNSFFNYEPDPATLPRMNISTPVITYEAIPWDPSGTAPTIDYEGGETADGTLVDPFTGEFVDLTIFIERPDGAVGIFFWDPTTLADELRVP